MFASESMLLLRQPLPLPFPRPGSWPPVEPELRLVTAPDARQNRLLAALPDAVWQRLRFALEPTELKLGQVLCESGRAFTQAIFPSTAVVSLMVMSENGASAQIAAVGNEGMVGVPLFMGGGSTPSRAVVQSAGAGFRLNAAVLLDEFNRGGPAQQLLLRYTQALITQMAQTAVCNRHHSLEQQLCRWLLQTLDRVRGSELLATQELIASQLGVRREGVTEHAVGLQKAGLIRYARGRISVLDRPGLERRSCECYAVLRQEHRRLLPAL